jgi:hypothetical protein
MALAFVKSAKGVSATAITTPAFGSATTAGNLIVLAFASDDYNGTPDTGWTQSAEMEQQTFHGGYIWWRISTGETTLQTYTIGSATQSAWVAAEFSGNDAAPYDTSQGQFVATSGASYTTDIIVPSVGQRLLVAAICGSLPANQTGVLGTWLNSFTSIDSQGTIAGATDDIVGLAYRIVTGDGSTSFSTGASYTVGVQDSRSGLIISFKESSTTNTIMFADQARS